MFFIKYPIKDQVVNLIYAKKKNISLKNQCNKYQKKKISIKKFTVIRRQKLNKHRQK